MKNLKHKVMGFVCALLLFAGAGLLFGENRAKANLKICSEDENTIVGTAVVFRESYSTSKNSIPNYARTAYRLYITVDGKKTLLDDDVEYTFMTDGTDIYYISLGSYMKAADIENLHKTTVYKYTISTGEKKKLVTSTGLRFANCASTKYAYLTYQKKKFMWDQYGLYVLNLSTGKLKNLGKDQGACNIYKNRVYVYASGGDICYDYKIYSYKLDGTKKKVIAKGAFAGVKKGKVYSVQQKKNGLIRGFKCNLLGKKKKPITKWLPEDKFPWKKVYHH